MGKENVVYIHNGEYTAIKNEIMLFAGKWMVVETIMLSKIRHNEKDKYHISFIYRV
jgi:hypothetical protein